MGSPIVMYVGDLSPASEPCRAALESHGYRVKTVSDAPSAIRMLRATPVRAALLNYKQEGTESELVAFHIKQELPDLPIILLSACFEMPEPILWLVDEYVMKSDGPERLLSVIDRVTRRQQVRRTFPRARFQPPD